MTTPLPFSYGKGRSLVDKHHLRVAGFADFVLGGLLVLFGDLSTMVFGVVLIVLGLATWVFTAFGSLPFTQLSPGKKVVVFFGSLGFLLVGVLALLWSLAKKIVDILLRRPDPRHPH